MKTIIKAFLSELVTVFLSSKIGAKIFNGHITISAVKEGEVSGKIVISTETYQITVKHIV